MGIFLSREEVKNIAREAIFEDHCKRHKQQFQTQLLEAMQKDAERQGWKCDLTNCTFEMYREWYINKHLQRVTMQAVYGQPAEWSINPEALLNVSPKPELKPDKFNNG